MKWSEAYRSNTLPIRDTVDTVDTMAGPGAAPPPPVMLSTVSTVSRPGRAHPAEGAAHSVNSVNSVHCVTPSIEGSGGGAAPAPADLTAALSGAYSADDVLADRQAIAEEPPGRPVPPSIPPDDLVERLAAALAVDRPWQRIEGDPARAMAYFRGMARNRLARLDPLARGLLVSSAEAEARRWAALAVHASGAGR